MTDHAAALGGPLAEFLDEMVPRAAKAGHKRFPLVPVQDFEQFFWERVLREPAKFRDLLEVGSDGAIWEELRRAATKLGSEDDRYRRAQRAVAAGYDVDDEQYYSRRQLRGVLPELIEAEFEIGTVMERALSGSAGSAVKVQVSESQDSFERYMTTMLDVIEAFRKVSRGHQKLLTTYYSENQEDTEAGRWARTSLASSMGLTLNALQHKVYRALDELVRKLGGRNPWLRGMREAAPRSEVD